MSFSAIVPFVFFSGFSSLLYQVIWHRYLAIALGTYHRDDSGPFVSTGQPVANRAGALGAWLANALVYVFGISAWWWVALAIVLHVFHHAASISVDDYTEMKG